MSDAKPKIVLFHCNWCAAAAADLAGDHWLAYPVTVRPIGVPCVGTINPLLIVKALQQGAAGVLVIGCNPEDCHYHSGNKIARRKFSLLKKFLEYLGIEPERVQFSWVTASEGQRFNALVNKMAQDVARLEPARKLVANA